MAAQQLYQMVGDVQFVLGCMVHIRSVFIIVDNGWLLVMNGYNGLRAWQLIVTNE